MKYDLAETKPKFSTPDPSAGAMEGEERFLSKPMLKVVQKTSKQVDDGTATFGQLFSTPHNAAIGGAYELKGKNYKSQRVLFVPLGFKMSYRKFDKDTFELLWATDDEHDPCIQAEGTDENGDSLAWKFRCWDFIMFGPINHEPVAAFEKQDQPMVMVVSFSNMAGGNGKALWRSLRGQRYHEWAIEMWTERHENEKGSWFNLCARKSLRLQDKAAVENLGALVAEHAALLAPPQMSEPAAIEAEVHINDADSKLPF